MNRLLNREQARRVADMPRKITTADVLRSARIRAELSVAELAEQSGVTAQQIHKIEAGQHEPRMATARALAEVLGIQAADLLLIEVA